MAHRILYEGHVYEFSTVNCIDEDHIFDGEYPTWILDEPERFKVEPYRLGRGSMDMNDCSDIYIGVTMIDRARKREIYIPNGTVILKLVDSLILIFISTGKSVRYEF